MNEQGKFNLTSALLVVIFILSACNGQIQLPRPQASSATPTTVASTSTPEPTATALPTSTSTPVPPISVWMEPYLPADLLGSIALAPGVVEADGPENAANKIQVGGQTALSQWVYALVAPFPTIPDGVTAQELQGAWQGSSKPSAGAPSAGASFAGSPILVDESTLGVFTALWGAPAEGAVKMLPSRELLQTAWDSSPAWAIVPFEALEPRWKVLEVDGVSPLDKEFDPSAYPLTVNFSLQASPLAASLLAASPAVSGDGPLDVNSIVQSWQATNRDPSKMTDVMLTGVTALVRATAETMRRKGNTYPGQDIRDILRSADFAHVSNEIPFTPDCPLPDAWQKELVFCSQPSYIELLEDVGTDVVELTGDHFGDQGADAMRYTLDLYKEKGMRYYGGGYDLEDARKPLLIEHNGNRLAFLGCNAKGPGYATARENNPGAILCDFDWLSSEIARVKAEGYLPIVTFQHIEYYTYVPQPKLIEDFHKVADAGAVIVSGSQAHQPHGFEFYKDAMIHYGLGNLFFDQYHMGLPTGQGFIDRHIFYDGRYISTELIGIRFIDFARPRPMTPEEREELLRSVFDASLW